MQKNIKNTKALIKRKNLKEFLKKKKIKRINPEALKEIENHLINELEKLTDLLKENSIITGTRNIKKENIKSIIKSIDDNYPET